MSKALAVYLRAGLIFLLLVPLVITPQTLAPFLLGKALYARALIEIITALWIFGLLWKIAPRPPRSWVLLAFAAYVIIAAISAYWGVSFTRSIWSTYVRMTGVWDLFHWLILVVVASAVIGSLKDWRTIINCNLGIALCLCLVALAQSAGLSAQCRVTAALGHPSYLAAILVVTTTLAVGLLIQSFLRAEGKATGAPGASSFNKLETAAEPELTPGLEPVGERYLVAWRVFWGLVAFLGVWVLLLTGTRGALLGLVGGAVAMPVALLIWGNRGVLRPILLTAGIILSAVVVLFAVEWTVGLRIGGGCHQDVIPTKLVQTSTEEGSVAQRIRAAEAGLNAFLARPLLGWGPENFEPAFESHVDPAFFKSETQLYDQSTDFKHVVTAFDDPHNKVIADLATKGALGALAYLVLWGAMAWAILRRRRPPREEVLAYVMLGALSGFFIQSLFLFDTPSTMLQLALLMAWVASQEGKPADQDKKPADQAQESGGQEPGPGAREALPGVGQPVHEAGGSPFHLAAFFWGRWVVAAAIVLLVGLSLYHLTYQPYSAAKKIIAVFGGQGATIGAERLTLAEESFDTFPPLANFPRALVFTEIAEQWDELKEEERSQALSLVTRELSKGLEVEPQSFPLMMSAVLVLRQDPSTLPMVEPLLERIREIAPERVQVHVLLAEQELIKGNPEEALRIAQEYQRRVPGTEWFFREVSKPGQQSGLTP